MVKPDCEHKWVYLSTHYSQGRDGYSQCKTYERLDVMFCEKCCNTKEILKEATRYLGDEPPLWWRH